MQAERVYSVLLVSAAEKMNTRLTAFFSGGGFEPVTVVDSVAKAQRRLLDREYDLVIVNSPLPDDFGKKLYIMFFAIEYMCRGRKACNMAECIGINDTVSEGAVSAHGKSGDISVFSFIG